MSLFKQLQKFKENEKFSHISVNRHIALKTELIKKIKTNPYAKYYEITIKESYDENISSYERTKNWLQSEGFGVIDIIEFNPISNNRTLKIIFENE